MNCKGCSLELNDDATACHRCGTPVEGAKAAPAEPAAPPAPPADSTPTPEVDEDEDEDDDEDEVPVEAEETETDVLPPPRAARKPTKAKKAKTTKRKR